MTKSEKARLVKERRKMTEEAFQDLRQGVACLSFHLNELLLSRQKRTKTAVVKVEKDEVRRGPDVSGLMQALISG